MMANKNYTLEEKAEALKKMAEEGIATVAKELGISRTTLSNWKKQAEGALKAAGDLVEDAVAKVAKEAKEKKPAANEIIIQSPMGGNITPAEILEKTGPVDKVYIRVDENKAYWVRGDENGSVELW